jgi:hypothetical protein
MRAAAKISCVLAVVAAGLCQSASAQNLSLPLNGYFHPGRAMPVRWDSSSPPTADTTIKLWAVGAVTSRVELSAAQHGVFPWLVIDRAAPASQIDTPLHPLQTSDCLIATALPDDSLSADLFPGRSMVTIHLDPAEPIEGPPMAWETLDALILPRRNYARLSPSFRTELFLLGVDLAVDGDRPPDTDFPWKKSGWLWIASAGLGLPPIISTDAYAPTWGWTAGRTPEFRGRNFLLGVIFCLLISGVTLWRSRWMPAGIAMLCVLFALVVNWQNGRQSPIARAAGSIQLISSHNLNDTWLYLLSHRPADFNVPIRGEIHPVLADSSGLDAANFTLVCDDHGNPIEFRGRLCADSSLALLFRHQAAISLNTISEIVESPMRTLAMGSIYPGCSIVGESSASPAPLAAETIWPTVILWKSSPPK